MDLVLGFADNFLLTPYVYPVTWPETSILRQTISLYVISTIGGYALYFLLTIFSYFFIFDRRLMKHPLFIKDQIRLEIVYTCKSVPLMAIPTVWLFLLEVRGYSKLYDNVSDMRLGWAGIVLSLFTFILFTDMCIYWIHRGLHHKTIYRYIHKDHHRWKVPTPFASHAFHPVDGFLQSVPYHIYPLLFPLHKVTYLTMFVLVNFWTVSIHDGDYRVPTYLRPFVNGSAHHTDHHLFYNYNYGQFFTLWDKLAGSFREPSAFLGNGPIKVIEEMEAKQSETNGVGKGKKQEMHQNGHSQTEKHVTRQRGSTRS